jgi:hypothetical protein
MSQNLKVYVGMMSTDFESLCLNIYSLNEIGESSLRCIFIWQISRALSSFHHPMRSLLCKIFALESLTRIYEVVSNVPVHIPLKG